MDADEVKQRILQFLDRHYRVPAGSMIRLGRLWSCDRCGGDVLLGRPAERRFECAACGAHVGAPCRALPVCGCGTDRFRVGTGNLYDQDHFVEQEGLSAALCAGCLRPQPISLEPTRKSNVARPAILSSGRSLHLRDLPELLEVYSGLAFSDEAEKAIRDLVAAAPVDPPPVTPDLARKIQQRVDELRDDWPISACKERKSVPLYSTSALYLWCVRPDGVVLEMDLDSAVNKTEPVSDPLIRFVMILRGTQDYPELVELLHPPRSAAPCSSCGATGRYFDFSCPPCDGLGWIST